MNLALEKLKKYGFNERFLTESDLLDICEQENITVLSCDVPTSFYLDVEGEYFIVLQKTLKGLPRDFALAHEISHHLLHCGATTDRAFFLNLLDSKNEVEADALATIALCPRRALYSFDFLEEHPNAFARRVFKNRQKLDFLYGV